MALIAVVSGGSGYVGTEVTKQLLEKGYTVRATVRSTSNKDKVAHLLALGDALPGKLELHEADLLKEGSFDAVVKGAHFVFHTASPFQRKVEDRQRDLVDPAVNGTKIVLGAVAKSLDTVKRVVLTSSFAAVVKVKAGPGSGSLYTEEDWNNESAMQDDHETYMYSKVAAERAAWELSKEHGFKLCVINPSFVLGPVVSSRTDATSIDTMKAFIENREDTIIPWIVDVRDIGRAHVLAAEVQKELGLQLHPPHETFVDMARTLITLGIAKPVKA